MSIKKISSFNFWLLYALPFAFFFCLSSLWVFNIIEKSQRIELQAKLERGLTTFKYYSQSIESIADFLQNNENLKGKFIHISKALDSLDLVMSKQERQDLSVYYEKLNMPHKDKIQFLKDQKYDPISKKLHYLYIAKNPYALGKKGLLDHAQDYSKYSQLHQGLHQQLSSVSRKFNFFDILYVRKKDMRVIYSTEKSHDFARPLNTNSYAASPLAQSVKKVIETENRNASSFHKLSNNKEYQNNANTFISLPVKHEGELIGVLVLQLSIDSYVPIYKEMTLADGEHMCWLDFSETVYGCDFNNDQLTFEGLAKLTSVQQAILSVNGLIKEKGFTGNKVLSAYQNYNIWGNDYVLVVQKSFKSIWLKFAEFMTISFISLLATICIGMLLKAIIRLPEQKFNSL